MTKPRATCGVLGCTRLAGHVSRHSESAVSGIDERFLFQLRLSIADLVMFRDMMEEAADGPDQSAVVARSVSDQIAYLFEDDDPSTQQMLARLADKESDK